MFAFAETSQNEGAVKKKKKKTGSSLKWMTTSQEQVLVTIYATFYVSKSKF